MAQILCDAGDSGTQFTPATPPHPGLDGGFCSIRSLPSACRRRVAPLMVQFPPFTGGEAAVRGGEAAVRGYVAPTVQTSSDTNADNGVSWARSPALWTQRRLTWRIAHT